ncbi:phage exclusion protein Lit family protein [Gluconobacter wancherniae]|uniref:phage exclusion protein Lit family protein n=1 Tax=Gluconobacter wancherniae TaxID=1307955 RepID=UPI001B8C79B3|nr:phage exclusion protein Lit family protein [Gluconobacter wancherniae]MBS1089506.1 hypothetical protein [Gluconobacter wancherniae]
MGQDRLELIDWLHNPLAKSKSKLHVQRRKPFDGWIAGFATNERPVEYGNMREDYEPGMNAGLGMANARVSSSRSTKDATHSLFKVACSSPFAIAPERAAELKMQVMNTEDWTLNPSETEANFWVVVPDKSIYLSYAGLASLWCLSRVAFTTIYMASQISRDPDAKGVDQVDLGQVWTERHLDKYVAYARRLVTSDEAWPEVLQVPDATAASDSGEGRLNNLFLGALSWIMLHEIGHAHYQHSKWVGADQRVRQEYEADAFATSWILEKAGNGIDREYRVLAIIVALAWLFLHEQVKGGGKDHPAAILRFREAVAAFELGPRSPAAENGVYLLKALFDPISEDMPAGMKSHEAFDWMATRMEELFGQ